MSSQYDEDDELAQWAGGYFNAEGSVGIYPHTEHNGIGYGMKQSIFVTATTPEAAGLFDGEGTITFQPTKRERAGIGASLSTGVTIEMTTLHDIERFAMWIKSLGIEPNTRHEENENPEWQDTYIVQVQSWSNVKRVLNELLPYLSKSKFIQAYIATEEILPRYKNQMHLEKRGYIECMSWIDLGRRYKGGTNADLTFDYFNKKVWPDVEPRDSHMAPSKEEFERQLFGEQERETFEDKTGPGSRSPSDDYDPDDDPFDF